MTIDLDHINISTPLALMEQVREFYCTVFELEVGERPDFGIAGYWLYAAQKPLVHLIESDNHRDVRDSHLDHVAFKTSNLQGLRDRLDRLDWEYSMIERPEFNMAQVFFRDPAGIQLEANVYG